MKNLNSALIRYTAGVIALVLGVVLSITGSDRGALFTAPAPGALAYGEETPSGYDLPALAVMQRVVMQMRENYVEPTRIDPDRMLVHALDRVQNVVPEVVTLFNADLDANPTEVEVRVGAQRQIFDLPPMESVFALTFKLREIFLFMQEHLNPDETDLRDVEYAAINGMLNTLDPHSVLLSPEIYAEMQTNNRGSFGGLGIVISVRDGQLTIMSPIDGTPASEAGLRSGDRIVKISDESTINMPLEEAVSRLRGDPGTDVTLEIMRASWTEPHEYTLTRRIIQIESVKHENLGDGIGYVRITDFAGNTHDLLTQALQEFRDSPEGLRGLVLDLRNNPGGLLDQAIRISDTFLEEGTIVTTVVGERMRDDNMANRRGTEPNYPIVVLINPGSASASEIVAGALKNNNRAIIVGDQSFGKGSVQHLYAFQDGSALKLTVMQYLTPGDVSIQGVGIVPDIQIYPSTITDESLDMYPNAERWMREADYEQSLTSDRLAAQQDVPAALVYYYSEPEETNPDAIEDPDAFRMDFEVEFAKDMLLRASETFERSAVLGLVSGVIEATQDEQLLLIRERLRERGIDWSEGENVIQPVTMEATLSRGDEVLRSGDEVDLTLAITNRGSSTLHRVRAVSTSSYGLFDDREFVFGALAPGETREWTVHVEIPLQDASRMEAIVFHPYADTVDLGEETTMLVSVQGQARPHFGLTYFIDDVAGGNGDGRLQVGETVTFSIDGSNNGTGDAEETLFILRNRSDNAVFLRSGRETVEGLPSGSSHRASFEFELREMPESGLVELSAELYDTVFQEYLVEEIEVPVATESAESAAADGTMEAVADTFFYGFANDEAPRRISVPQGTRLSLGRHAEGWIRLAWGEEIGWSPAVDWATSTGTPTEADAPTTVSALQPPMIVLSRDVLHTDSDTFDVVGTASDDIGVLDYYIFVESLVSERRTRTLKRAYEFVGQPETEIRATVPLSVGMNRIAVVARDNTRASNSEVIFVYRHQ
jgi:carboxyl-terminal processing protease